MARKINYDEWSKEELIKELRRIKETKYGLVWHRDLPEEKIDILINPDARTPNEMFPNEMAGKPFPILKETKGKEVGGDKGKPVNLLIEGDNYHSLAVLNFTHHEAIDLIYIDPPYNTGNNDFIYNDLQARPVQKDDPFKHSKWLGFMEKRLRLSKHLLKKDGVIFISINEEEQAQLKLLCDEIFGEENYLTMFSVKVRHEERILKGDKDFHEVVEYLYLYRKSNEFRTIKKIKDNTSLEEYVYQVRELTKNPEIIKFGDKEARAFKPGDFEVIKTDPNIKNLKKISIRGSIKEGNSSGRFYMRNLNGMTDKNGGYLIRVPDMGDDGLGFRYFLIPASTKRVNGDYFQGVPLNREDTKEVPYPNFLDFVDEFNNVGYEGGIEFRNGKKPAAFIRHVFEMGGVLKNKEAVILDFFAGSGSTGQAVLQANKDDNGIRQFILCTNNEEIDNNGNAIKHRICTDVCYPRLKKVIKGYKNPKGENVAGLGGNLKYYVCDFVEAEPTDRNKRKLVSESTEMLCIRENAFELVQDESNFKIFKNSDKYLGIVFYEEAIGDFKKAIKKIKGHFNAYIFSMTDDPHKDQFEDLGDKVTLCAIPEVILKVYREIFK